MKMTFDFDTNLSAAQNIEKYFQYIESGDPEFGALLRAQLPAMLPLSDNSALRAASRQKFNSVVLKELDKPRTGQAK
jgi:hypothetical protein